MRVIVTGSPNFRRYLYSLSTDDEIKKKLEKMLDVLESNPVAGEQIQRSLWPKDHKKAGFDNLFRYEIDNSMRATYTIRRIGSWFLPAC